MDLENNIYKIVAILTQSLPPRYFDDSTNNEMQENIVNDLMFGYSKIVRELQTSVKEIAETND